MVFGDTKVQRYGGTPEKRTSEKSATVWWRDYLILVEPLPYTGRVTTLYW